MIKPVYIECNICKNWSLEEKASHKDCYQCKGKRAIQDPNSRYCNMCGGNMFLDHHPNYSKSVGEIGGLVDAKAEGDYNSYHLLDMANYVFSLCELCLRTMFRQFKIPPRVEQIGFDYFDAIPPILTPWEVDEKYYQLQLWKDAGGEHQAYVEDRCNRIKDCPNKAVYSIYYDGELTEQCACEEHKEEVRSSSQTLQAFVPFRLKAFM